VRFRELDGNFTAAVRIVIPCIDSGIRAIAALLVFWGHAINAVHQKIEADFPHLYGPFGVDLFFVISGFVMVYSSERLFGQPGAPITFFVRRLARIVPLYWLATAVLVWFVVPYASTKGRPWLIIFCSTHSFGGAPSLRRMDTDLRNVLLCRVCHCTACEAAFRSRCGRHNFSDLFLGALGA
jgi:hypothetical protein